jgi:hypothetical protein
LAFRERERGRERWRWKGKEVGKEIEELTGGVHLFLIIF